MGLKRKIKIGDLDEITRSAYPFCFFNNCLRVFYVFQQRNHAYDINAVVSKWQKLAFSNKKAFAIRATCDVWIYCHNKTFFSKRFKTCRKSPYIYATRVAGYLKALKKFPKQPPPLR